MVYYFFLLNKHKRLSLKRKSDYKRNLIIAVLLTIFPILFLTLLFATMPKEDIKIISAFLVPSIIILDFSLRFFLKQNTDAAINSYLTLPISLKTLILYIVLSDLSRFWIWGCGLIYGIILTYFGVLTVWSIIWVLCFILLSNYLIAFIKAVMGNYAIFIYPFCLTLVFLIWLITNVLNPIVALTMIVFIVLSLGVALFFTLRENLYIELNRIAL